MGIERFFSSIRHSGITKGDEGFIIDKKMNVDSVMFDFNSEIHSVSTMVASEINKKIKEQIYNNEEPICKDDIDRKVIDRLKNRVLSVVKNFTQQDNVKEIFIAIDGVPTMGKLMEQRRRRYLGFVIEQMKKDIFKKHKNKIPKKKRIFLENKVSFNKGKISPGTRFMLDLYNSIRSNSYKNYVKKGIKNLKKLTVSGYNEYGEGEMKIFWKAKDNTLIVSPDSDVTLLGLLLTNNYSNISILRYDQQQNVYEIIDIDTLRNNLLKYCNERSTTKVQDNATVSDLVVLFTFFGNDFIPNIKSIDVKSGFKTIIDIYIKSADKHGNLIENDNINTKCLIDILNRLSSIEKKSLQEKYISENYKNYKYLKSILNIDNGSFVDKMSEFLDDLRLLNDKLDKFKDFKLNKLNFKTKDFLKKLRQLVRLGGVFKSDEQFIIKYKEHKNRTGSYPEVNIRFRRYSNTFDEYHENKLQSIVDEITPYDIEVYKLDNMLSEYRSILGIKSVDLGKVYIENYQFKELPFDKAIKNYYDKYNKQDMCREYVKGFVFTFKHYLLSHKFIPVMWFYQYSKPPLISDIYDFVVKNQKYINKMKLEITNNYFNSVQHLAYTSPNDELKPEEYRKQNRYTERIKKTINCTGQIFLSKCFIETYPEDPRNFIKRTDKIKKSIETKHILGEYEPSQRDESIPDIITINQFQMNQ